jgi:seryl-tRNA synthetase
MRRRIVRGILVTPEILAQSSAAQRQAQQTADPAVALLSEVRALRSEIAEVARISLRSQLLVARVQLQEQRIMYLDRRRAELAGEVAEATEKTRQAASKAELMVKELDAIRSGRPSLPAEQVENIRREIASQIEILRADLQAAQGQEQALRVQEAEISSGLATEQGRWTDFNSRLDELERALPAR